MKVYDRPKFRGKTTALVELLFEPGNEDVIFVAPTTNQAEIGFGIAREIAKERGVEAPSRTRFERVSQVAYRIQTGDRRHRYVFDEFDGVADFLLGGPVLAIALTSEANK